jgi:WD40 repeat protein
VTSLAFSDDGNYLVAAGQGELRIYCVMNVVGPGLTAAMLVKRIDGLTGEVRAVVFKDHASLVITASDDGIAKVWDVRTGKLLAARDPHGRPLTSLALAAHDQRLWLAGDDGTLGEWDVGVDTSTNDTLAAFMGRHVPWKLGAEVANQRAEGAQGGKH